MKKKNLEVTVKIGFENEEEFEKTKIHKKYRRNIFDNMNAARSTKYILNLHRHMTRWTVYKPWVAPISENHCGYLAPSQFNGLSYLTYNVNPQRADVYRIETGSFREVNIWCPKDSDFCIISSTGVGNPV